MSEFAEFQQAAKLFPETLKKQYSRYSCSGFFNPCLPQLISNSALEDSQFISLSATILKETTDIDEDKKYKVLVGVYLFIWSRYDNSLAKYRNGPLLELIQNQLKVNSLAEFEAQNFDDSLSAFSEFCALIYKYRDKTAQFSRLYQLFSPAIQPEIYQLRMHKPVNDSSWYGTLTEWMNSVGF